MHLVAGLGGIAFDGDRISRFRAAEETVLGNSGAAQTGDRGNPCQQIELEAGNRRTFVTSRGSIDSEENQVFEVVAKFYFAEFGEAADKESGRNQENHGNGHLSDYQDFSRRKAPV